MSAPSPTLRYERELLRSQESWSLLGGLDEVGRGALAGPVSVGLVVVSASTPSAPSGVRDSKLMTAPARERIEPRLRRWGIARAVGHASPQEIDSVGILGALRLAARRALAEVTDAGCAPDVLLLDGSHDWFTDPGQVGLFADLDATASGPPVITRVKADQRCSSVAAASVLAKVERDGLMRSLAAADSSLDPYGFAVNKGYAAPGHLDALRRLGPTVHHRRSWRLPGIEGIAEPQRPADPASVGHNGPAGHDGPQERESTT